MELKKASINDKSELQEICKKTYTEVFANHWTGNDLELYLEQQFGNSINQTKNYERQDKPPTRIRTVQQKE